MIVNEITDIIPSFFTAEPEPESPTPTPESLAPIPEPITPEPNPEPTAPSSTTFTLSSISFIARAHDDVTDLRESIVWNTPYNRPEREEPYTDAELLAICDEIAGQVDLYGQLAERLAKRKDDVTPPTPITLTESEQKAKWVSDIDNDIYEIIAKKTRFQMGYVEREAAAIAFRDSGYEGVPTVWISEFAESTGQSYQAASDLILSQAGALRNGLRDLEALRMRKYRLLAPTVTLIEAEDLFNQIISGAYLINQSLP